MCIRDRLWGVPVSEMPADWAAQRVKGLTLGNAIMNALMPKRNQKEITSLIEEFQYPKYGPGMMWEACRDQVLEDEERDRHKLDRRIADEEHWMRYGVTARRKRNQGRLRALQDFRKDRKDALANRVGLHPPKKAVRRRQRCGQTSFRYDLHGPQKQQSSWVVRVRCAGGEAKCLDVSVYFPLHVPPGDESFASMQTAPVPLAAPAPVEPGNTLPAGSRGVARLRPGMRQRQVRRT